MMTKTHSIACVAYKSTPTLRIKLSVFLLALAFAVYPVLADQGSALFNALKLYKSGDYELALELFIPLAEAGNLEAQNKLSHMYYYGEGTRPDYAQHYKWSLRSAQQGSSFGAFNVGFDYFNGMGVEKDIAKALKWIRVSAEMDDPYALVSLANASFTGIKGFVDVDYAAGLSYLRRAVKTGDGEAALRLGMILQNGQFGVEKSESQALKLYTQAASKRVLVAQHGLALMYDMGKGTKRDTLEAAKWALLAVWGGCARTNSLYATLMSELSGAEGKKVLRMAKEWREANPARDPHDHRNYGEGFCAVKRAPARGIEGPTATS